MQVDFERVKTQDDCEKSTNFHPILSPSFNFIKVYSDQLTDDVSQETFY